MRAPFFGGCGLAVLSFFDPTVENRLITADGMAAKDLEDPK